MFNNIEPIIDRIKEYRCRTILIVGVLFLCPLVVVHILFKLESGHDFITAEWSAGDLISYIAGFGAFIGTVSLGIVTVLQNQKLYKETNKMEIRNLAIDKYALFTFGEIEAKFYNDGESLDNS